MTNISSESKRSWDALDAEPHKRLRNREEPKDWRDVHLKSPRRNNPASGRVIDRRTTGEYSGSGRRSPDHRRKNKHSRVSRDRDREEGYTRRSDSRRSPASERDHRINNGHSQPLNY